MQAIIILPDLIQPRHSMCTRFLYAVLPSELYWGDKSLDHLNAYFASNLQQLYEEGVKVP